MTRAWLVRGSLVLGLLGGVTSVHGSAQNVIRDGPLDRPADAPKGTGLVLGRVVEGDTDRPVAGAIVTFSLPGTGSVLFSSTLMSVATDEQGRFVIRDAPARLTRTDVANSPVENRDATMPSSSSR